MSKSTLISKIPTGHFGEIPKLVFQDIQDGNCSTVTGIPGYGMEFLAKHLSNLLEQERIDHLVIDSRFIETDLESMMEKKSFEDPNQLKPSKSIREKIKNEKVALILAELDKPLREMDIEYLDSLRWTSPDNFVVINIATYSIIADRDDYHSNGSDIFNKVHIVKLFDRDRAKWIFDSNNREYNWKIPSSYFTEIFNLSGGSPALMKYICMALYEEGFEVIKQPDILLDLQPLKSRVKDIAEAMMVLNIEEMKDFGILDDHGEIFSVLAKIYLTNTNKSPYLQSIQGLSDTEKRILYAFIENRNRVISKDQISTLMMQTTENYSEWAIYKAVERLRNKVKGRYTIETIKGKGWVLRL